MHRYHFRSLPLLALLAISVPFTALAASGPKPVLKPNAPAGVAPGTAEKNKTLSEAERKKARFHLDFDKVDITEVIKYIAQWTGKNFILADNLRGKITIIGPTDVTADEAYAAFLAALKTNNFQVTPTGKFLKVEPMKDTIRTPIPLCTEPTCPNLPLTEQMVTRMFRLKYNDAEPMKNIIQQFTSREGEIDPFPPDLLIVSDTGLNVARIEKLIAALDMPGSQDEIHVVQLYHATAQEMSQTLTQIFQPQQAGGGASKSSRPVINLAKDAGAPPGPAGAKTATSEAEAAGAVTVTKIIPEERSNKLIIIANAKAFQRVSELIMRLDVATPAGGVHVVPLQNADAEEVATTLSSVASGASSSRRGRTGGGTGAPGTPPPAAAAAAGGAAGSGALFSGEVKITADKSTNSLLIVASQNDYRNVLQVVSQLDIRRRQVFIEAVVMEVKLNNSDTLNIDWHTGFAPSVPIPGQSGTGLAPVLIGSEQSSAAASLSVTNVASLTGFLAGIQGPPITVPGLNITLPSFGVLLNALQSNSDVNVISTPHLLTTDNEEAEIHVGQTVPFQSAVSLGGAGLASLAGLSGTSTTTASSALGLTGLSGLLGGYTPIQRTPVELSLKIKAHINEGDYVKLEIDEHVENISSVSQTLGPTTSNRQVKTTVVAKDQTSVVIGGLIQEQVTHAESRTPILGEIPVIGALFRSDQITREKTNLLLFLTPYIIRDQSDFRAIFERKLKERQEFVARYFGNEDQYQVKVDYERKHGPLSVLIQNIKQDYSRVENGGPGIPGERVIKPEGPPPTTTTPTTPGTAPEGTTAPRAPAETPSPEVAPPPETQSGGEAPATETPPPNEVAPLEAPPAQEGGP